MSYFPVFMNLESQPVLVVGGGQVAERKVRALLKAGAAVTVLAPQLSDALQKLFAEDQIVYRKKEFSTDSLEGFWLVFAATNNADLNQQVYREGERRGIPVNAVDDTEHCRFISPAIIDRSPVQIAVSTAGTSPMLARAIRSWIEKLLPAGLGRLAVMAGKIRRKSLAGESLDERRRKWAFLFDRQKAVAWSNHSDQKLAESIEAELSAGPSVKPAGRVFLVGAGPGHPDLLTIRAREVLQMADVILHDRLVSPEILDGARRDARFIDVGKRVGAQKGIQAGICEQLVSHARSGQTVVRLKGGDAFVFGRGGEEIEHLKANGIEYEVVPGITAALGCAAFAGIPLTHRDHAKRLSITTGHLARHKIDGENIQPWHHDETLVVYMGVKQAQSVQSQLLDQGMPASTPVALIINGTMETQKVLHGTVSTLPAIASQVGKGEPGLFIIGEVAALGRELAWFRQAPAFDKAA